MAAAGAQADIRPYRHTTTRAIVTIAIIVAVCLLALARVVAVDALVRELTVGPVFQAVLVIRITEFGLWVVGLVAWGLWLSRVVENVPALGGGWPTMSPRQALIDTIVPLINLRRTPSTIREVMTRLPGDSRGELLVALWAWSLWIWLLGPWAIGLVLGFVASDTAQIASMSVWLQALSTVLVCIAGVLAVSVVFDVDDRQRARAEAAAAPSGVG